MDILVSTEWLAGELDASDLRLLDASYWALDPDRDARAHHEKAHIPGALFMNLGELKDDANPAPFMMPSPEKFASRMQALGVGNATRVVLYDDTPHVTSARAWWMLKTFGADRVAILDGGLRKWREEGRPLSDEPSLYSRRHFTLNFDARAVRTLNQMLANVETQVEQVVDARGAGRFTGEEPDLRGLPVGHIPGSVNLPYERLFHADGTWKVGEELKAEFDTAGIDLSRPLTTTCGSGVTAAVLLFAAHLLGKGDVGLYDGSWSEWAADPSTPKALGPA